LTCRVLLPRQTALLRFSGPLQEDELDRIMAAGKKLELPKQFLATAFYHLNDSSFPNDYKTIESSEAVRLIICKNSRAPE